MEYNEAIEHIRTGFKNDDWFVGTFDACGVKFNASVPYGSRYLMIYRTESGFYVEGAMNEEDLRILKAAKNPCDIIAIED